MAPPAPHTDAFARSRSRRWTRSLLGLLSLWLLAISAAAGTFEPVSVMCEVNGFLVPAVVDTGAEITVMSASCARRCGLSSRVDTQHSGRAVGVGSSEIIGGIDALNLRIGPLSFQNKVSVLKNSQCDILIGLDVLQRFQSEISLRDRSLRLFVRGEELRIPFGASEAMPQTASSACRSGAERVVLNPAMTVTERDEYLDDYYDEDCGDFVSMAGV